MEISNITIQELKNWIDNEKDMLLLDVLPPEYYTEKHIKGALNAPVYEIAFLDHVRKLTGDLNKTIVVCNERESSLSAQDAAEKLIKAGYKNVYACNGALEAWEGAGYPLEKGEQIEMSSFKEGGYEVDVEKSTLQWIGRNAKYAHSGNINIKSGKIIFKGGVLESGMFVIDMTSIRDNDLSDSVMKGVLESHLKSPDFFDVDEYPEAMFSIKTARLSDNVSLGVSSYDISGILTIKDVNNTIDFPAMVTPVGDGSINVQAHFDFDRTLWNVRYGSEKFFEKLGMHLVNDMVSVELFLVAKRN